MMQCTRSERELEGGILKDWAGEGRVWSKEDQVREGVSLTP
jgi:hypothetical protein